MQTHITTATAPARAIFATAGAELLATVVSEPRFPRYLSARASLASSSPSCVLRSAGRDRRCGLGRRNLSPKRPANSSTSSRPRAWLPGCPSREWISATQAA